MFITKLGPFNGDTWENLCQLVFKSKHGIDGYQEMPASPGDFGIEGYTINTGRAFQCYCPDRIYTQQVLLDKQKRKITDDVNKLKKFQLELKGRLGGTQIKEWCFVSPEINHHNLLSHAKVKEVEARDWGLDILHPNFTIHLHDADFYLREINEQRSLNGVAISFGNQVTSLPLLDSDPELYEQHLLRKSTLRLVEKMDPPSEKLVGRLYNFTLQTFLEHDNYFNALNAASPTIYFRLVRLLSVFEQDVKEWAFTWSGTAESLIEKVTDKLAERIVSELRPGVDHTLASEITRHTVARWLAACELDFE